MKKDISKTTTTQKQGKAKRRQLRETKQNRAGLETGKKRAANRMTRGSEGEQEVKEGPGNEVSEVGEEGQALAAMKAGEGKGYTIGIDLGDKRSRYCILDKEGKIVRESSVATAPGALKLVFGKLAGCRIAIEVGTHSPWVSRTLAALGHEVIVANARQLPLIYGSRRKNDKLDAEKLARLARMDATLLKGIRHRGEEGQGELMLIRARAQVVETRTGLVNMVRGLVKSRGERLPGCTTEGFVVGLLGRMDEAAVRALKPMMVLIEQMTETIKGYDKQVEEMGKKHAEIARLDQVSGVGPLIAATYILTIEDPERFGKSRDVGGYLGLVPGQSDSGESQPQKRITKAGDGYLRYLLVQGAQYILGPFGPDTDLRRWGLKLGSSGGDRGKKRAVVAVARKLAILLLVLWKTGAKYEPLRNSNKQKVAA
jgi:transposase